MKASRQRAAASADAGAGKATKLSTHSVLPSTAPADTPFLPGPILLLGAPGVGKGTQAQILVAKFAIPQISTGDLLRAIRNDPVKASTPDGSLAKRLMDAGQLVPDDLVNRIVANRLLEPDTTDGYILDGFPRTLAQAQWLDGHLIETGSPAPIIAVEIRVDEAQLLRRITGRRTCPKCNRIYNIYFNPPRLDEVCDDDATPLCQRADDTEPAFRKRMEEYRAKTLPVIPHYKAAGRFRTVNGDASVESVATDILCALKDLRRVASDCSASQTGVR